MPAILGRAAPIAATLGLLFTLGAAAATPARDDALQGAVAVEVTVLSQSLMAGSAHAACIVNEAPVRERVSALLTEGRIPVLDDPPSSGQVKELERQIEDARSRLRNAPPQQRPELWRSIEALERERDLWLHPLHILVALRSLRVTEELCATMVVVEAWTYARGASFPGLGRKMDASVRLWARDGLAYAPPSRVEARVLEAVEAAARNLIAEWKAANP